MVIEYASFRGSMDGMHPEVITEIAHYYEHELGYTIPPMTPFVGENFNVTRAGIHADGMMKDGEIYNIFDTGSILGRAANVSISNTSGLAGLAFWINNHYDLTGENAVGKQDPVVGSMKARIDRMYEEGRNTVMSNEELEQMLEELAPGRFRR